MKKNSFPLNTFSFAIIASLLFFCSCTPVKNVVYFENMAKDTTIQNLVDNNMELKIRKNDVLDISIISPDPETTPLFNGAQIVSSSSGESSGGKTSPANGYVVDNKGNIEIYKLGSIRAEGLTRSQLKQRLQQALIPYLKDAVVTVRFANHKVTILGEVAKPQIINIPNEQLTLLDAIAQSGDLTFTGRRDNVLVIRETGAGKQFKRINLSNNSIINSPFYYLKPDDVVYVEPTQYKLKTANQNQQVIGYVLTGVSIIISLLTIIIR